MLDRSWVLIAAVLLCCSICALAETFNPAKLRLIDFDLGFQNYLFRSNSPMTSNDTFAYDELVAAMADEASQANATLPEHFFIVDLVRKSQQVLARYLFVALRTRKSTFHERRVRWTDYTTQCPVPDHAHTRAEP